MPGQTMTMTMNRSRDGKTLCASFRCTCCWNQRPIGEVAESGGKLKSGAGLLAMWHPSCQSKVRSMGEADVIDTVL